MLPRGPVEKGWQTPRETPHQLSEVAIRTERLEENKYSVLNYEIMNNMLKM